MWIVYRDKTCINYIERPLCVNEQMGSNAHSDVCIAEANEGGRRWLFCFSKRESACAFFPSSFLALTGKLGNCWCTEGL